MALMLSKVMATSFGLCRLQQHYLLMYIGRKFLHTYYYNQRHAGTVVVEVDVIDNFTTQLMQKKFNNWETLLARRRTLISHNVPPTTNTAESLQLDFDFKQLNSEELETFLKDSIENCNNLMVNSIINHYFDYNKLPSVTSILQILSLYSTKGDKNGIYKIMSLCEKLEPKFLQANSGFRHYLAEATWIKGNVNEAITIFECVYRENIYLRRKISSMLKCLIVTVVPNRSEATLVLLLGCSERLAKDFNDFIPLMYIWKLCFLSEWYSEQCLAIELLQRYNGLYDQVSAKFTHIVALALKSNRTEVVYKLLEMLLMLKRNSHFATVLEVLFDHKVHHGDLRGCTEIMQWAVEQNVDLPALQQKKFVDLLFMYKVGLSLRIQGTKQSRSSGIYYKF